MLTVYLTSALLYVVCLCF